MIINYYLFINNKKACIEYEKNLNRLAYHESEDLIKYNNDFIERN